MSRFEDKFSKLQADMVSICMEYVEDRADKLYLYASCEEGVISSDFFYLINNKYVKRNKLNDALEYMDERYDVTTKRQAMVLEILIEDIEGIEELSKKHGKEMLTEMKLIYDVESGSLKSEYKYDLIYTHDDNKTADHIADEWFEEIKSNKL